jgi:hypothetical protein
MRLAKERLFHGTPYGVGLLVLCVWVSLKWRAPTGIVYGFLNCDNHKLKAMISCGVGLLGRASR